MNPRSAPKELFNRSVQMLLKMKKTADKFLIKVRKENMGMPARKVIKQKFNTEKIRDRSLNKSKMRFRNLEMSSSFLSKTCKLYRSILAKQLNKHNKLKMRLNIDSFTVFSFSPKS